MHKSIQHVCIQCLTQLWNGCYRRSNASALHASGWQCNFIEESAKAYKVGRDTGRDPNAISRCQVKPMPAYALCSCCWAHQQEMGYPVKQDGDWGYAICQSWQFHPAQLILCTCQSPDQILQDTFRQCTETHLCMSLRQAQQPLHYIDWAQRLSAASARHVWLLRWIEHECVNYSHLLFKPVLTHETKTIHHCSCCLQWHNSKNVTAGCYLMNVQT